MTLQQDRLVIRPADAVIETVAADVLTGLSITVLRASHPSTLAAAVVTLRTRFAAADLRVAVPDWAAATDPAKLAAAILPSAAVHGVGQPGCPPDPLGHVLSRPDMQDLVVLISGADRLPASAFQMMNLLLQKARSGTSKVRIVLFGLDSPWPELHRVRQNLCFTYFMPETTLAALVTRPRRRIVHRVGTTLALVSVVGCCLIALFPWREPSRSLFQAEPETPAADRTLAADPVGSTSPEPQASATLPSPVEPSSAAVTRDSPFLAQDDQSALPPDLQTPETPSMERPLRNGLIFVARPGDTLATLYERVYRRSAKPPFADVQEMNPNPLRPGTRVMFPEPPNGWLPQTPTARDASTTVSH